MGLPSKIITVVLFFVLMMAFGIIWRPISEMLGDWLTATLGLYGHTAVLVAFLAVCGYFGYWRKS